ncbi:hypothetical protein EDD21DRAFT_349490 [Dissophora ornata]|nr:hypothetical protein EDD21DRAFT_349490 [Dissophora ornata]
MPLSDYDKSIKAKVMASELIEERKAILSPHLALQLQRARAVQQEAARVARDAENALKFKDCEAKLQDLMKSILHEAAAIKRRKCTLQYFQSSIAGLERTLLEVKGLNQVGAGRKCQKMNYLGVKLGSNPAGVQKTCIPYPKIARRISERSDLGLRALGPS